MKPAFYKAIIVLITIYSSYSVYSQSSQVNGQEPDNIYGKNNYLQDRVRRNQFVEREMAAYSNWRTAAVPTTGLEYDAKYYRLELRINPDTSIGKYIKGIVTTYFTTNQNNFSQINFDFATPLICDSVYYHGSKLSPAAIIRPTDLLQLSIPNIPVAETLDSITVFYKGVPPTVPYFGGGTGYVKSTHDGGKNYVYTLSEPYSSYTWWPCKSFIVNDKADSLDLYVSTPLGFKTAGNGKLISETVNGSSLITYWKERYPIAAYQVCTGVANYVQYPSVADTVIIGGTKMPVFNYLFPETNTPDAHTSLDRVNLMITTLSAKFGDYPFKEEKYGNYTFGFGGGMEHNTFSGESATWVYDQAYYWDILAHELGHQWFGANVTNGSWGDIWINESFATFSESLCAEFAPSISAAAGETGLSRRGYHKSLAINSGNQYQSVYVTDTSNMATIFTPAVFVYERGAMVINMMRTLLGDTKFFQALQNIQTDPLLKGGNAFTADIKRHMEDVSGLDLTTFFNQWIYEKGFAEYSNAKWNNLGKIISFQLSQTARYSALSHFDMPVAIRIQGSNPVTMDTTIIVYDKAGILYYDVDGVLTNAGSNIVQYSLSFIPTTITFDAFNQVLGKGNFVKDLGLSVLPTTILSFTGNRNGTNNILQWKIDDAFDYDFFTIERSEDGSFFQPIGKMLSDEHVGSHDFTFVDKDVNDKSYFYRIGIKQRSGATIYSKIIYLNTGINKVTYRISPNPASGFINIESKETGKATVNIYAANGVKVKSIQQLSFSGNNSAQIAVSELKSGVYFVEILSPGKQKFTSRISIVN